MISYSDLQKMTTKYFIPACMLFLSPGLNAIPFADDVKYRVADIPKPLLNDAKAVVRNAEIPVEIKPDNKSVHKVKYTITLLNKNGAIDPGHLEYQYTAEFCVGSIVELNCRMSVLPDRSI